PYEDEEREGQGSACGPRLKSHQPPYGGTLGAALLDCIHALGKAQLSPYNIEDEMHMDAQLVRFSKFISLVLRHQPEQHGLTLDAHGWAQIDELIAAANRAGVALTRDALRQVVEQNDKQRFAISDDGRSIRARQGHSVTVNLELLPLEPPPQ